MKFLFDLHVHGASGIVHPFIFGHPSPMTFVFYAQALVHRLWKEGIAEYPGKAQAPALLREVGVTIGVRGFELRGRESEAGKWSFPVGRSAEIAVEHSPRTPNMQAQGDHPKMDGHWKILVDLPDRLLPEDLTTDRLALHLERFRMSMPFSGGMVMEDGTTPVCHVEDNLPDLLNRCWVMREVGLEDPEENLHVFTNHIRHSRRPALNCMPTVIGHVLLETPVDAHRRRGIRRGVEHHAYADTVAGLVGWQVPKEGLPLWRVESVGPADGHYGYIEATTRPAHAVEAVPEDYSGF